MVNMIKNTINDVFNVEVIKRDIDKAFSELVISGEDTHIRICTLVSGASGTYLPHEVAKLFAEDLLCSNTESNMYWYEWETLQSNLERFIKCATTKYDLLANSPFIGAYLTFSVEETDGDFVLALELPENTWDRYFTCAECGDLFDRRNDKSYELKGKLYCEECYKPLAKEYFEDRWMNGGSFMSKLCDLCTVADLENLSKLKKAFPEVVDGYCMYGMGKLIK